MSHKEFNILLDDLLELDRGTTAGTHRLSDIPKWDSLAIIGFIALLDQHFGVSVPAASINNCQTVDDLAALTGGKVTG